MTKAYTTLNVVKHGLRSVNRNQLAVPPIKLSTYSGWCFSVSGPTIGTVCRITLETLLYFWTFFGTI